jgi:hypothetical protein
MPTPSLYAKFAQSVVAFLRSAGWKFIGGLIVIPLLLVGLERTLPVVGKVPGKILFVLFIAYLALLAPLLAFGMSSPNLTSSRRRTASLWFLAALCNLWILLCAWFIYAALFAKQ